MNCKKIALPARQLLSLALAFSILITIFSLWTVKAQALSMYIRKDYVIHSVLDENMVLDVDNNGHADETNIQLWKQNGTAAQVFHLEPSGVSGYYYIVHTDSGKVLDIQGGGTASGTNVQLYTKNGTDAQLWEPLLAGSSQVYVTFKAKCGKVLDVSGGATSSGTNIWIYDSNGTSAQAFHLVPVDGCNTAYVNTSSANLNLRSAPSTSASILAKLPKGTAVEIVTVDENGWTQVMHNGRVGYVSSEYLKTGTASQSTASSAEQQIYDRLKAMANGSYGNGVYKTGTRYTGAFANEQCKGFAKKVHMILFGYNIGSTKSKPNNYQISISSGNTSLVGSLTGLSSGSTGKVSNLFSKARAGDFIQVRRSHGGSHSMIFLSSDANGVTVYECNVDGRNGIQTATYSWKKFCTSNAAVSVYTAKDYRLH